MSVSNTGNNASGGGISILTSVVLPAVVGGVLAITALGGLVYSQTQGPEKNPASQEILVYGN